LLQFTRRKEVGLRVGKLELRTTLSKQKQLIAKRDKCTIAAITYPSSRSIARA
jgi:hypothetical protein